MSKSYVVFTLNSGKELIGIPAKEMRANELKEHINISLKEESFVFVGRYGIPAESLKHYEIRDYESVS